MMQYSQNPPPPPPPPPFHSLIPPPSPKQIPTYKTRPTNPPRQYSNSTIPTPKTLTSSSSASVVGDANCMEQLLVHCATAVESNDATLTQQILWVLNNIASPDGDSNQRLTCAFLRALTARAARSGSSTLLAAAMANGRFPDKNSLSSVETHKFSVIELAGFVDLTPWHRFGFTAANSAILDATDGYSIIHIVDLGLTHCMQIPTLIDAIAANRPENPPLLKLTVAEFTGENILPRPLLNLSYTELGTKLVNFAKTRNITMEFRSIPSTYSNGFSSLLEQIKLHRLLYIDEALIINCHLLLHYIPEETLALTPSIEYSLRSLFLKEVRDLNPTLVVLVEEDADLTSSDLIKRVRSAFNSFWIPFDSVDTCGSRERMWYEAEVRWKIENVVACEGAERVERVEPKNRWVGRMRNLGFRGVGFSEEGVQEVKSMIDEHAAGWGLKIEESDHLVLTWKGHNVVFATIWVPS